MRNFLTWNPEIFKLEASMGSSIERFPYRSLRTLIPLTLMCQQQQQQQHSLFSQASWGRLEMKPERNKFKVQAH